MNSSRLQAGIGALLAACVVASVVWMGNGIRGLRGDVSAVRDEVRTIRTDADGQLAHIRDRLNKTVCAEKTVAATSEVEVPVDPLAGVDFKKVSDIVSKVDSMVGAWKGQGRTENAQIEDLAGLLVEIDEWFFVPEEQPKAYSIIKKEVLLLRSLIKNQIAKLSEAAIAASDGKRAAANMAQINRLLSLYPAPSTAAEQSELEQVTSGIFATSRRVEEIRYLRYNQWAISQIEDGLQRYRSELEIGSVQALTKLVKKDREKLRTAAILTMRDIDTAFLNPAAMDLYNYAYTLYRDAMGTDDDERARLAKGFADPSIKRQTPADF